MSSVSNDRRGLIFTINSEPDPVYQVESSAWAQASSRWSEEEMPPAIRAQIASLRETGQPGAFVQLVQGEVGVYVILETNIKRIPEAAAEDIVVAQGAQPEGAPTLAPYDIVICAKQGTVSTEDGETFETREGDCYVLKSQSWGRFYLPPTMEPDYITTTKRFLLLLDELHGKNFLSMCPDPDGEALPPDFGEAIPVPTAINCYVLNLSRFRR